MTETKVVNARTVLPAPAAERLRQLFGVAGEARRVAELALEVATLAAGIDPARVVAFDGDTGELVLDEPDPDRMAASD